MFYHKIVLKIWKEKTSPEDWLKSVFVPIPKKVTRYSAAIIEPLSQQQNTPQNDCQSNGGKT